MCSELASLLSYGVIQQNKYHEDLMYDISHGQITLQDIL